MGARRWPLRAIRFHPEGAACRGEAPPRHYLLVAYPHVIDGLGSAFFVDVVFACHEIFPFPFYDVAPNGKHFAMLERVGGRAPEATPPTVVLNWFARVAWMVAASQK
jgi:hypothetical protein